MNLSSHFIMIACFVAALAPGATMTHTHAQEHDLDKTRAPRIKTIVPANGDSNVDPKVSEIRVTFDMAMNHDGYSFTGGGPNFPTPTGTPKWVDAYTCVLPVKLKSNWDYRFGINSANHKSFRSVWLVPAEIATVTFKTRDATTSERSPDEQRSLNVASFDALCDALRRKYSYFEHCGVDWESHFAMHRRTVVEQKSTIEWSVAAAAMLRAAKDPHLHFTVNSQPVPTYIRLTRANVDRKGLKQSLRNVKQQSGAVTTGQTQEGYAYLAIHSWSYDVRDEIKAAQDYLRAARGAPGIIIDVRRNGGGSESLAESIAAWFVNQPAVYAKHVYRTTQGPRGFSPMRERTVEPNQPPDRYDGPVAVLMGPKNLSSCEAFLLMMKQAPNAILIGETSGGSSGNPKPIHLPNGVVVNIPSWKAMFPDGTVLEDKGIDPDVRIPWDSRNNTVKDPVLDAAINALKKRAAIPQSRTSDDDQ